MKIIHVVCILLVAFIFLSNGNGAAGSQGADRTGSPIGNGTCGSCHDGGNFTPALTVSVLEGEQVVTRYIPGKQYQIKVLLEGKNNPKEYGFQLVALNGSNHVQAGIFGQAPAGFKQVILDNRRYIEQASPRVSNSFIIPWTAPSAGAGTVRFYVSGLATNNNNGTGGDSPIHLTTPLSISETVASFTSNIKELKGSFLISPNPVGDILQMQIKNADQKELFFYVTDLFGRNIWQKKYLLLDKEFEMNIPVEEWFPGFYHLYVTDNIAVKALPFIKN